MTETIHALSSGALPAGIAVVRVSGPGAFAALRRLTPKPVEPRRATLRTLAKDGVVIDTALVLAFPAPASATGEDVAEFHLHGGIAVVAALFAALERAGSRLARAGEFTRRAFDTGRLDLTQVEGLADLIAAETEAQRRAALDQAGGALRRRVEDWRDRLVVLLADTEAELDFADEGDVVARVGAGDDAVATLIAELDAELRAAGRARALRNGLTVVVSGPPNVGKSSLINALAGRDVALVSPVPGTTRDAIEVRLDLGGVLVTLVDTAGLRDTDDAIEAAGIARARERIADADLVLALHCDGAPGDGVPVRTKRDLGRAGYSLAVSAVTGEGIAELEEWLRDWATSVASPGASALLSQTRTRDACARARTELADAAQQIDPVLRAEALRLALRALGEITGSVNVETVLDAVFARFCIGK
ncbi:tRNA uridine-5-carboxymethylaminomethyl(34) synthesis GTPase MnmE [Glacieibacterium frigidum]|uniref:tRNA modification GTPase MnmE n=1 Tax=Glacieibacterium frigidum TaxID=2593303 RepID=A0A552UA13_9SPHN|nr:tRNA uridine-5-carboxymethylaminomethyl(34) synthesis GTPase MnmE [Glacieibacterium frigidum]TRW15057.1 tRNA uridine-5-carboxymethylaminomethyl(34) synthesis GTPase MnmE [Glacieibacterium frigidum]